MRGRFAIGQSLGDFKRKKDDEEAIERVENPHDQHFKVGVYQPNRIHAFKQQVVQPGIQYTSAAFVLFVGINKPALKVNAMRPTLCNFDHQKLIVTHHVAFGKNGRNESEKQANKQH